MGRGNTDGSPHFHCGDNNAEYVAMDQIVKVTQSDKKTPSIPSEDNKGFLDIVTESFQPPPMVKPVSSATTVHSKFVIGDHVVLQPVDSAPIRGIVRWVGPVRTSKDTGGIVIPVVGVETVSTINNYYWYSVDVCICYIG